MGGTDKGLQNFDGAPLIAHVLRRIVPQVGPMLISANRNIDRYASFGYPVIADGTADFRGPLAGLYAGLMACTTDYLIAVPCDAPFVPDDLVDRLAASFANDDCDLAVASTGGRLHPVFCLMRRDVSSALGRHIEAGGRRVHGWIATMRMRAVSFPDESAFSNLNTLDELRAAEADR